MIEELQTQLENSNKNVHAIQAQLKNVMGSETRLKVHAEELAEQVSDYETRLVQSQADVESLQELYQVIHQDVLAYRKIQGLFSPGTNILKSLTQEREAAKNEKQLMSSQIVDLEK